MQLSRVSQQVLECRVRDLGAIAPRCAALLVGYVCVVVLYSTEREPGWMLPPVACAAFAVLAGHLLAMLHMGASPSAELAARSGALLDRLPSWRRVDDVQLPGVDLEHVVATPAGLLAVRTAWRQATGAQDGVLQAQLADAEQAARGARRIRRLAAAVPNPLDVPVRGALLLFGGGSAQVVSGWDEQAGVFMLDASAPWGWPAELTATGDVAGPAVGEAFRKVESWAIRHRRPLGCRAAIRVVVSALSQGWSDRERRCGRRLGYRLVRA